MPRWRNRLARRTYIQCSLGEDRAGAWSYAEAVSSILTRGTLFLNLIYFLFLYLLEIGSDLMANYLGFLKIIFLLLEFKHRTRTGFSIVIL